MLDLSLLDLKFYTNPTPVCLVPSIPPCENEPNRSLDESVISGVIHSALKHEWFPLLPPPYDSGGCVYDSLGLVGSVRHPLVEDSNADSVNYNTDDDSDAGSDVCDEALWSCCAVPHRCQRLPAAGVQQDVSCQNTDRNTGGEKHGVRCVVTSACLPRALEACPEGIVGQKARSRSDHGN